MDENCFTSPVVVETRVQLFDWVRCDVFLLLLLVGDERKVRSSVICGDSVGDGVNGDVLVDTNHPFNACPFSQCFWSNMG